MVDVEVLILDELDKLSPREASCAADWDDVLRRAQSNPNGARALRVRRDRPRYVVVRGHNVRRGTLALVGAALALAATGAAVAGLMLAKTPAQESQGLLDGHSVFTGSHPLCTRVAEQQFHCVLDREPGSLGTVIEGSYLGAKFQTVDAQKRIDGGCVGVSDDGRVWDCYLGELAVEHGILSPEVLGQTQADPGHG